MIVEGSEQYFLAMLVVISSMFSGWPLPANGILVIPGRSKIEKVSDYQQV
jgi:hypothetical protein